MDTLRPPAPLDPQPEAYRDWLHFNVFDARSGVVGLVNLSLQGAPSDPRSRAVATALVHHPRRGWFGNMEIRSFDFAHLTDRSIGLATAGILASADDQRLDVSVNMADDELALECRARPSSSALRVEQRMPFGSGWISWSVEPRLMLSGWMTLGNERISLDGASGYHDHNWGRWRWGDDIGWDWATLVDDESATTIVFSRATDRDRRSVSDALVTVDTGGKRLSFRGASVRFSPNGSFDEPLRRLPGSLAALHVDRLKPSLPGSVVVEANDGYASLRVEFQVRAAAQLIASEPTRAGCSFIHELVGAFSGQLKTGARSLSLSGVGVVEYVD